MSNNIFKSGAIIDTRLKEKKLKDFKFEEIVANVNPVNWIEKTPDQWRKFPIFQQNGSGSCVAQTEAKELGIMRWLKDGIYVHFSATDIYQQRANKPSAGMNAADARMAQIKYLVVHHTSVPHRHNPDQWIQTNAYHKQQFGMLSSLGFYGGYNYEIAADGSIKQLREDGEETAAQKGHNKDSLSFCLDGDFDSEMPTSAQIASLGKLLDEKMKKYSIPADNIVPHRKFANKTCYGLLLADDWARNIALNYQLEQARSLLASLWEKFKELLKGRKVS